MSFWFYLNFIKGFFMENLVFYRFFSPFFIAFFGLIASASFTFDRELYYPIPTYNGSREMGNSF